MAIHSSAQSMRHESLTEMIKAAEYCVTYRKDPQEWGSSGCYGYPAAILLFAIADAIGSVILKGNVKNHLNIFNHHYYNLNLSQDSIDDLYYKYRNTLTHNAIIGAPDFVLDLGNPDSDVFETKDGMPHLNLVPFLKVSQNAVADFLNDQQRQ